MNDSDGVRRHFSVKISSIGEKVLVVKREEKNAYHHSYKEELRFDKKLMEDQLHKKHCTPFLVL